MPRTTIFNARSCSIIGGLATALVAAFAACGGTGSAPGAGGAGGNAAGPSTGAAPSTGATPSTGGAPSTGTGVPQSVSCAIATSDILVSLGPATTPAIVWSKDHYVVAWSSSAIDGGDILLAVLDADGNKQSEVAVDDGPGAARKPQIVPTATGYLVLWEESLGSGSVARGRYIDAAGMPIGTAFQIAASSHQESRPVGVASKSGIGVAWMDNSSAYVGLLSGQTLSGKNTLSNASHPALADGGGELGLAWVSGNKIGFSRLGAPLAAVDTIALRSAPGHANVPRLAAEPSGAFDVAWEDNRDGDGNESVYISRIAEDGAVTPELRVSVGKTSGNYPDVVVVGQQPAVTYYQFRDGPPAVYLAIVAPDLSAVEDDIQLSGGTGARYPRAASTGDTIGVVYAQNNGSIRMSLVKCAQ